MKITQVRYFRFQRPDGEFVEISVPPNWVQNLVRDTCRSEYTVHLLIGSKPPAEADFGKVSIGKGSTGGFIIPGAAILSPENPHANNPVYCAYNMLVADAICQASYIKNYDLCPAEFVSARSRDHIFRQSAYYLITWKKIFVPEINEIRDFSISFCNSGLVFSNSKQHPSQLYSDYEGDGKTIKLKSNKSLPDHVVSIICSLVPYCDNPFLRFFYLYQVIEYLMGIEFDSRVSDVRNEFAGIINPSIVQIREILEKFQDVTREKTRIKAALKNPCPFTALLAENILSSLNSLDPETSFAERIYRIRNILFHEYSILHEKAKDIDLLCRTLFSYLVEKKLLA